MTHPHPAARSARPATDAPTHDLPADPLRRARILIVDDEEEMVGVLTRILSRAGCGSVRTTRDPRRALPLYREFQPDLILLDLHMPGLDGLTVLGQLRSAIPADSYVPILTLTGDDGLEARRRALAMGAKDFLTKPFDVTEVLLRIRNLLETRFLHRELQRYSEALEAKVAERTEELERTQLEILERLAGVAEVRDSDTGQHTQRVATLASRLAVAMELGEETADLIRRAAPLHDLGKIGIPDGILRKSGSLTDDEAEIMRRHTTIGAAMLAGGRSALMRAAEQIALSHHERWDGGGYPNGLAGESIPLPARLVAVADVFDALTHPRPYRPAWSTADALAEIARGSGRRFDPAVTQAFFRLADPKPGPADSPSSSSRARRG